MQPKPKPAKGNSRPKPGRNRRTTHKADRLEYREALVIVLHPSLFEKQVAA